MKLILFLFVIFNLTAQEKASRKNVAEANKLIAKDDHSDEDVQMALNTYLSELSVDPKNPVLWYNLGNAYFKKKNFPQARESYKKAFEFTDTLDLAELNYNIGNTYLFEGKADTSISYYKKALELNSSDIDTKYNIELARAIIKEKSKKQQQNQENQDPKQKPPLPSEFAKKLYEESKNLTNAHKFNEALDIMNKALQSDPSVTAYKKYIDKLTQSINILEQ